jgi:hypothetical protein
MVDMFKDHLENHLPECYGLPPKEAKVFAPRIYRELKRFIKMVKRSQGY